MIVEAVKKADGYYIPSEALGGVHADRIKLKIEFVHDNDQPADYSALDQMIGLCDTHIHDASEKHDEILYGKRR